MLYYGGLWPWLFGWRAVWSDILGSHSFYENHFICPLFKPQISYMGIWQAPFRVQRGGNKSPVHNGCSFVCFFKFFYSLPLQRMSANTFLKSQVHLIWMSPLRGTLLLSRHSPPLQLEKFWGCAHSLTRLAHVLACLASGPWVVVILFSLVDVEAATYTQ